MRHTLVMMALCLIALVVAAVKFANVVKKDVADEPNIGVWQPPPPPEILASQYDRLKKYLIEHPVGRPIAKKYLEDGKLLESEYYAIFLETERAEVQGLCEKPAEEAPK